MGIRERILEFIAYRGINKARFEKMVGLSNGYINSIKGSVGSDKLEKMLETFPDLDRIWLMTGEGSMLRPIGQPYHSFGDGAMLSYTTGGGYAGGSRQPGAEQSSQLLETLQELVKSNTVLTDNNSKLVANNTKLVDKLMDFLDGE